MTEDAVLELPVEFGNVSIGDKKARISVKAYKDDIPGHRCPKCQCMTLDTYLVQKRLLGCLRGYPRGVRYDPMPGMPDDCMEIIGAFAVHRYTLSHQTISFSLSMDLEKIDVVNLVIFAKRDGKLLVEEVEELPDEEEE